MDKRQYWAALPTEEIGGELIKRCQAYWDYCQRTGRLELWRKSRAQYNHSRTTGGNVLEKGKQGEYVVLSVNHYASILSNLLNLVTSQKIAWDPKASNTDFKSQVQTVLAKNLLDYYVREKRLDGELTRACEFALLYGEAGLLVEWDPLGGDLHAMEAPASAGDTLDEQYFSNEDAEPPSASRPIFKGDITAGVYSPIDIIRNPSSRVRVADSPWLIVRKFRNKFEIADKFSEYKNEIIEMSYVKDWGHHDYLGRETDDAIDDDEIPIFTFFHRTSALLPEGRMVEFLSEDIVLTDSPLPYEGLPLKWMAFREEDESPFGYSGMWDLLPLQGAVSALHSTMASNHKAFGLNLLLVPRGQGWDITKAASGLSVIEVDPALPGGSAPQAINLLGAQGEPMNYALSLVHDMETLSGVNSVARGNPEASLKSGAALALVQSMAIQFSQGLQKGYYRLLEDVGTTIISHLKAFADVPRVAEISGKSKRGVITEFQASDLESVTRVLVEAGNPLSKTLAGRVNLAELLLQQGVLKTSDDLLQVLETGNLESTLEGDMSAIMLMKAEAEALEDGSYPVQAMITDDHLRHIQEHSACLASPSARADLALVERVTAHQLEHIKMLTDPSNAILLAALGQQSMAPGPSPTPGPPAGGNGALGAAVDASNPIEGEMPSLPSMPDNALTGEQAPSPMLA